MDGRSSNGKNGHPPSADDAAAGAYERAAQGAASPVAAESPLGLHESGYLHASGAARYVDDLPPPHGQLVGLAVTSPHAHARILRRCAGRAPEVPGVAAILFAGDIPGHNQVGPVLHDEPLLAEDEVHTEGQAVALVVGESYAACRHAAQLIEIDYQPLPALLDVKDAIARGSFQGEPHFMRRGTDAERAQAFAGAALVLEGEYENGGQEHFYLESQAALVVPGEDRTYQVSSSTQHPSEVQAKVAEVLGLPRRQVAVEVPRMGGGFGGKETQAAPVAAMAALGAWRTRRPVKVWLNRDQDMVQTGKRHPFHTRYRAAFDAQGNLLALEARVVANGGWSMDLSRSILDRALFHLDNCYYVPLLHFEGRVARTNLCSMTAFRGFGGPQGMLVIEEIMERAAERLALDPVEVRRRNFYGAAPRNMTPYHQEVEDFRGHRLFDELVVSAELARRRVEVARFNQDSPHSKRGLGVVPVKFGISFTATFLNQAGALVLIYADGSVQLSHGGTEMGQGLHTKMLNVCAHELGVPVEHIRVMNTATDRVPNTSATAASSGSDLNGQAVKQACEILRERLRPVAARLLAVPEELAARLRFARGQVVLAASDAPDGQERKVAFAEVTQAAYMAQVQLFAAGYYRTPGIAYDARQGRGRPFYYFAYGAAVTEVEVSGLTGEHRVLRVDILHDVGTSLAPSIDRGQIEGGYIQGLGWLTSEELRWSHDGRLLTHSPSTYKIPAIGDAPLDFRVGLLERAPQEGVIHGSKAVGEPPLMLAISALTALRHAVTAFAAAGSRPDVDLQPPATPEAILRAIDRAQQHATISPSAPSPDPLSLAK
jgi:xanthine dehydrogenase large subunit